MGKGAIKMATEQIQNGGFEAGLAGWGDGVPAQCVGGPWAVSAFAHSGTKSVMADAPAKCIAQDLSGRFTFDMITSFKVWQYHAGPVTRIYLYFTDGTYVYWNLCGGGGEGCGSSTWNEIDLLANVWAGQPYSTYKNKRLAKIVLFLLWIGSGRAYVDDISMVSDTFEEDDIIIDDGPYNCPIEWRERQGCNIAVRNVPLRTVGSFVDTGTWTLRNRRLYITLRLTDAQKTTLQATFDGHIEVTVEAGDWTYTGWFVTKPLVYEYSKDGDGNEREWIVEMEFALSSFSYSP